MNTSKSNLLKIYAEDSNIDVDYENDNIVEINESKILPFLDLEFFINLVANALIVKSCSNNEYLASCSVGVIRSKPLKSNIFPHLLAT